MFYRMFSEYRERSQYVSVELKVKLHRLRLFLNQAIKREQ